MTPVHNRAWEDRPSSRAAIETAIVKAIEAGNHGEVAAEANGAWRAARSTNGYRADVAIRNGRGDAEDERYAQFAHAIARARARAETFAVQVLRAGKKSDPRLAIEWLKRARHHTWEPGMKVSGSVGVTGLPTNKEELVRAVQAELARVKGEDGDTSDKD